MIFRKSMIAAAIAVSGMTLAASAIGAPAGQLPAIQKQGAVTYMMGGIGQQEATAIKHAARRYPLELEFLLKAKPKEEYLSAVKVRINDAHQKTVLDVTADGPFLLAKMPAGKYTVTAEHDGKVESHMVAVAPKAHRRVVFEWKA
ncbi:MAG TPA: carboxypeptidase-like regulatory domain-containing protein [Burkholderiales bacterium]